MSLIVGRQDAQASCRPFWIRRAFARMLGMVFVCTLPLTASAQRPPITVPPASSTVIERLPAGYSQLARSSGAAAIGPDASIHQIQQLLAVAASTGDNRLAARADALLASLPTLDRRPDVLRARAFSAQHRHDFKESLRLLGLLIEQDPRDGEAQFARAQINLVQGRLTDVRRECSALVMGIDQSLGMLCIASLSLRTGAYDVASELFDRWLEQAAVNNESRRYVLVLRAETAWRNANDDADDWYRRAESLSRGDVRTLASHARYLRAIRRDAEVMPLLADAVDADGLTLQRALAAHALGTSDAASLADAQGRRYAIAHETGTQPEMREEAEYLLTLRDEPDAALALALRNFETQRDYEDVEILRRAAVAAKRPEALESLDAWAKSQKLTLGALP